MDRPRQRREDGSTTLQRIAAAGLAVLLAGLGGCAGRPGGATGSSWFGPSGPAAGSQPVARVTMEDNPFLVRLAPGAPLVMADTAVKAVQFKVLQVQAPLGEFSRSRKVWDHLDVQAVGIDTQMVLQRNGLRLALGGPESWPPVQAILDSIEKRTVRRLPPSTPNSLAVDLQLTGEPVDQTVFHYRPNGTLAGNFYGQATDVFRITWDFHRDNIEEVVVYVTPEIRQEQSGVTFKATRHGVAPVPVFEGKVFHELACRLVVPPGGYIVLGPGEDVDHAGLIGRQFLVNQIDGEPYESLLVIQPEVLDMGGKPAGQEAKSVPAK